MKKLKDWQDVLFLILEIMGTLGIVFVGLYYMQNFERFEDKWFNVFHIMLGAIVILKGVEWFPFNELKQITNRRNK